MLLDISPIESVHIFERAFSKEFANHRAPYYAEISGDSAVIHGFRNFDYLSKTDFRPRWETKIMQLSNLRAVDLLTNFCNCTTNLQLSVGATLNRQ